MQNNIPDHAVTHAGPFHADDVFASAFLRILKPNIIIERVQYVPRNYNGLAFDIGMGEFDHHQTQKQKRDNGVPYAAFGKLWQKYAAALIAKEQADLIDRRLVQPLDSADNGCGANLLSIMISAMNPIWNDDDSSDDYFWNAVDVAEKILRCVIIMQKMRISGKMQDDFMQDCDVYATLSDIFGKPVIMALCQTTKGATYKNEIMACARGELTKSCAYDETGKKCSFLNGVWREYGSLVVTSSVYGTFLRGFVETLDKVVRNNKRDDIFLTVLGDIRRHCRDFIPFLEQQIMNWVKHEITTAESRLSSREILLYAIRNARNDNVIVLNQFCPWRDMLITSSAKFVVYPSARGGYNIHTIPVSHSSKQAKVPFPQHWCNSDISVAQSEVSGIVFVHKGNFLITCKTLRDCYQVAAISGMAFFNKQLTQHEKDTLLPLLQDDNINTKQWVSDMLDDICIGYSKHELLRLADNMLRAYMPKQLQRQKLEWGQHHLRHLAST